jgi:hypothetical protein
MRLKLTDGVRSTRLLELSLRLRQSMRYAIALRLRFLLLAIGTLARLAQIDDISHG